MGKKRIACALSAVAMTLGSGVLAPVVFADAQDLTEDLTLTADVTDCYTVKSGSNVTINLGEYGIECTGSNAITVENGATLTIRGEGSVTAKTKYKAAVFNSIGGVVNIEDGTYLAEDWYTVKNLGTMTINGGVFNQGKNNKSNASLIDNGWYDGKSVNGNDQNVAHTDGVFAVMTINGGVFNHLTTTATIKSDDYSKTNVNGGEFYSANGQLLQASGEVRVTAGEFVGYRSLVIFIANGEADFEPGIAVIEGGKANVAYLATIDAGYASTAWKEGTLTVTGGDFSGLSQIIGLRGNIKGADSDNGMIKGGTYSIEPDAEYVTEGYQVYAGNNQTVFNVLPVMPNPGVEDEVSGEVEGTNTEKLSEAVNEVLGVLFDNFASFTDEDKYVVLESSDGAKFRVRSDLAKGILEDGLKITAVLDCSPFDEDELFDDEREALGDVLSEGMMVLGYADYEIGLVADGEEFGEVVKVFRPLSLTYDVSEAPEVPEGAIRVWKVVRLHRDPETGEVETTVLDAEYDDETKLVGFESDEFSAFVVTYEDIVEDEAVAEEGENDGVTTPETGTVTAAGASASVAALVTVVAVGVITAIASCAYLMRRKD